MTDDIIITGLTDITDCKMKVGTVTILIGMMNDAVMECKSSDAAAADAPATDAVAQEPAAAPPPAPATDANPSDQELITRAQPLIEQLKTVECKKQKRDIVGLMMIKKILDAMETMEQCKD